jgi:hypothetical protein
MYIYVYDDCVWSKHVNIYENMNEVMFQPTGYESVTFKIYTHICTSIYIWLIDSCDI